MNWQLTGQLGVEGQLPVQGSQELLTWGPNPTHMQHDRKPAYREQPQQTHSQPVADHRPQTMGTRGHAQRDRHVSWQGTAAETAETRADVNVPDQHQVVEGQQAAALPSTIGQPPAVPAGMMPAAMVPLAAAMSGLQLQDSSSPAAHPAATEQQPAHGQMQQPVQETSQPQPPQASAAVLAPKSQPAPSEAALAQQPAQARGSTAQRAATPAVTRRWVRPKPAQQRGWNDSTQSMGTVLRRKLPPAPPRAKSSKPLYSSPLFTARSQQKLDTEQRHSTDGTLQPKPAKAAPRKQPSASRLAPLHVTQMGGPQAPSPIRQPGQPQQPYQAQQPLAMTTMVPNLWGMLQPALPQHQLMTPLPLQTVQAPAVAPGIAQIKQQWQQQPAQPMPTRVPAVQAHGSSSQRQGQQERPQVQVSHQNSPAQMQPQMEHAKQMDMQVLQPQLQPQQWWQQPSLQQPVTGQLGASQAPWLPDNSQQQYVPSAAQQQPSAHGNMPAQQTQLQPAPLQPWPLQQQPSRQPSPAPPQARTQSNSRGLMYGRTVSMSGAGQQPGSRAPSTAGSARGSTTGGGTRSRGEWNSHFTKKTTRRRTAHIEPPRSTQPYTERLKSMARRRSSGNLGGAASNSVGPVLAQQAGMLPQYGMPGMLWPQQQPGLLPLPSSGAWGSMAGQVVPSQYGGWPPPQAAQWAQQHTMSAPSVQC